MTNINFTMNKAPDFSVIIPTYNRSKYVQYSIMSALRQKHVTLEVLVVDDGSDDTANVINKLNDKRIRYIKNKKRLGYAMNVKKCFINARGKYIFTLGDDDVILDENTLADVLDVMGTYKAGLGKIGGLSYEADPSIPNKAFIMSEKIVYVKPSGYNVIINKLYEFGLGFYSGLVFSNSMVNKDKFIDHMGYAYFPVAYELVKEHGCVYIPKHFILARLSFDMMPTYFDIKKHGSFFMDDLFNLVSQYLRDEDLKNYKKKFISNEIFLLPHMRYFSSYPNLLLTIKSLLKLDKGLLLNPKFYFYGTLAFSPRFTMNLMRKVLLNRSTKATENIIKKSHYYQNVKSIFGN